DRPSAGAERLGYSSFGCAGLSVLSGFSGRGFSRPALPRVMARITPADCFLEETRSMVLTRRSGCLFSIAVRQKRTSWARSLALPVPVQARVERLPEGPSGSFGSLTHQSLLSSPHRISSFWILPSS